MGKQETFYKRKRRSGRGFTGRTKKEIMADYAKRPVYIVGRVDGMAMAGTNPPTERVSFPTLKAAEKWLEGQHSIDAAGVEAGNYYIDGPCKERF